MTAELGLLFDQPPPCPLRRPPQHPRRHAFGLGIEGGDYLDQLDQDVGLQIVGGVGPGADHGGQRRPQPRQQHAGQSHRPGPAVDLGTADQQAQGAVAGLVGDRGVKQHRGQLGEHDGPPGERGSQLGAVEGQWRRLLAQEPERRLQGLEGGLF